MRCHMPWLPVKSHVVAQVELCKDLACAKGVHNCADADAWQEPVPPFGIANIK